MPRDNDSFKDLFSGHAPDYSAFRRTYPEPLFAYLASLITPEIDPIVFRFDHEILREFWLPEHHEVSRNYATLPFPFEEFDPPSHSMTVTWNLPHLTGFFNTWPSARRYHLGTGFDPVDAIRAELTAAWGDPAREREVTWPLHLRVGKVIGIAE